MNEETELSRRRFLTGVASAAASSFLPTIGAAALAAETGSAFGQEGHIRASREAPAPPPLSLVSTGYRLLIDSSKGSIASLRSTFGVDRELLIPDHAHLPLFIIELMDEHSVFTTINSSQGKMIEISRQSNEEEQTIAIQFTNIGGLPVDAKVTIRCPVNETLTYWNLTLSNQTRSWIAHIQFPVIRTPFDDLAKGDSSQLLWSYGDGSLQGPVEPSMSVGAWGAKGKNSPEAWRYNNYPGQWTSTQLMAHYDDAGGLYVACDDSKGLPKFITPLLDDDGITLGLGHYPGTQGPNEVKLPYNVVLGTFHGDWYAAAEIYRAWATKQLFCGQKLAQRTDAPKWIQESPIAIAFPMRGQCDWDGPATVNPEYTPATNALPYLEKLAREFESPLMPIVFNWEHSGPWVQPDAFPALGGDAALREFMEKARQKGWYPVLYGDGLSWVTQQKNTGYDGMPYFHAHNGEAAVSHKWDGTLLEDVWPWRKNYVACVGTEPGRQMILEMTGRMARFGPSVVQQFDQGPGPRACFATTHGHPPVPGPWMTAAFDDLLVEDAKSARSSHPDISMACEGAPPEVYLQHFQTWDARIRTCPLYSFLYHEYAHGHEGFYSNRIDDESLRLSVARALVTGYRVDFTLRDKGRIEYDWDQAWTRAVPDQSAILDWARRTNRFRTGVARDYLLYGRMLRPWKISRVTKRDFGWGKEPLVQSATWQAQDGRIGIVLANFADLGESPRVELEGHANKTLSLYLDGEQTQRQVTLPSVMDLEMLPRSLALIEMRP